MTGSSLRLRLLLLSAGSIAIALLIAGAAISAMFGNHVERNLRAGLEAQLIRLTALVNPDTPSVTLRQEMADPRYDVPASGLYWQVRDPQSGQVLRSRSLWDTTLDLQPAAPEGEIAAARLDGPNRDRVLAVGRLLQFERDGGPDRILELIAAENVAGIAAARAAFNTDLTTALAILALALIAASWAQVTLGLSPLGMIKRGVAAIRSGRTTALDGTYPSEVQPLVSEVNDLISTQERSIEFARQRAGDLAHGLKTSLTRLNGEANMLRRSGNTTSANAIEAMIADMTATVDHQLKLSRLRHRSRSNLKSTLLAPLANKVAAALKATPEGNFLVWMVEIGPDMRVALDAMDLTELLGVIFENASKWAQNQVKIGARAEGDNIHIAIEDDGPGLPEEALALLGQRGRRLDETRQGAVLGLAIAREIIALNAGTLSFARSGLGGLKVEITLQRGTSQ